MPITPGTPLADTDLPAATADAETNAAEIRTAIGAADAATNTGDETEGSILDKLKGAAADATRIGAEFLPDALEGAGDPNWPQSMTVTGTLTSDGTTPVVFPTLVFAGMRNGKPEYSSTGIGGGAQPYVAAYSQVGHPLQGWNLYQLTPYAAWFASSIAALPNLASGWGIVGSSTGTPILTAGPSVIASHLGQLYRDTTNDVWYRATQLDPPVWEEDVGVTNANVNTAIAANVANTQIALGGGTAGRALFGAADAAAARTTLGLGAFSTNGSITGTGALTLESAAASNINLTPGTAGFVRIVKASETGVRESLFRATVSDSSDTDGFYVSNGSVSDSRFAPAFAGVCNSTSTLWAIQLAGFVSAENDASDSSNFGLIDLVTFRSTSSTDPFNGTLGDVVNRKLLTVRSLTGTKVEVAASGAMKLNATTASTNTTTGALVVSGGAGIAGNINAGGTLTVTGASTLGRLKATIPNYADDAAADADAGLLSGQLYRTTAGGRTVYQKP